MKSRWPLLLVLALGLSVFGIGCSDDDDDNNPIIVTPEEAKTAQLDATSHDASVYFNLVTEDVVPEGENGDWHIAFKRFEGRLHSNLRGVDLESIDYENGMDFDAVSAATVSNLIDDDWFVNDTRYVVHGWYEYIHQDNSTPATGRLFAMQTNSGGYAKFVIDDPIIPAGMGQIGSLNLRYVYDDDGTDLSGAATTVNLTANSNQIFFSFDNGELAPIPDPASSTEWDLMWDGYTAMINGGSSGPGTCGVYPIYEETNDFAGLTEAPPNMGGSYEKDSSTNVFTSWYNYNGQTHEITSKGHVYVIEVDANTHFKLEFTNYYKNVDGSPVSGWISFDYLPLQ